MAGHILCDVGEGDECVGGVLLGGVRGAGSEQGDGPLSGEGELHLGVSAGDS